MRGDNHALMTPLLDPSLLDFFFFFVGPLSFSNSLYKWDET